MRWNQPLHSIRSDSHHFLFSLFTPIFKKQNDIWNECSEMYLTLYIHSSSFIPYSFTQIHPFKHPLIFFSAREEHKIRKKKITQGNVSKGKAQSDHRTVKWFIIIHGWYLNVFRDCPFHHTSICAFCRGLWQLPLAVGQNQ